MEDIKQLPVSYYTKVNTGRYYEVEYGHEDKAYLDAYTEKILDDIDPYRSPSKGKLILKDGLWTCIISHYGLD